MSDLKSQIEKLEARREELFKLKKPIDAELVRSYNELEKLRDQYTEFRLETEELSWEEVLENADKGMKHYKASMAKLESIGLTASGYFPSTNQRCVRFSVSREATDDQLFELEKKS